MGDRSIPLLAIITSLALDFSPPIPDDLQVPKYMGCTSDRSCIYACCDKSICITVASGWVTVQEADSYATAREVSGRACRFDSHSLKLPAEIRSSFWLDSLSDSEEPAITSRRGCSGGHRALHRRKQRGYEDMNCACVQAPIRRASDRPKGSDWISLDLHACVLRHKIKTARLPGAWKAGRARDVSHY